jgi:hypothetical protein
MDNIGQGMRSGLFQSLVRPGLFGALEAGQDDLTTHNAESVLHQF